MVALVLGCAALGGAVGALLPAWIARLPPPAPDPTPETDAAQNPEGAVEAEPSFESYAELTRLRGLPVTLGIATALAFALLAWHPGWSAGLPAALYVMAVGVLLCYVDLRVRLLPNAVVLPSYAVVSALLVLGAIVSGDWGALVRALAWAAGTWLVFAGLMLVFPAGFGFGDVKLIGLTSLALGWYGGAQVLVGLLGGFVLGGLVSIVMLVTRRATWKTALPFGPYLVGGYLLGQAFTVQVLDWYLAR